VTRHDQVGADQPAAARGQALQQRFENAERGIGHHRERPAGEAQVGGVGAHHGHRLAGEPLPQQRRPATVQFHGHHRGTCTQQLGRERAETGTDVENEVTGRDPGRFDQAPCSGVIELVPSPAWSRVRDHDAPS
jgi:hypothetical protein